MFDYLSIFQSIGGETLKSRGKKLRAQDANNSGADDAGGMALQILGEFVKTTDFKDIKNVKSIKNIAKTFRMVADQLEEAVEDIQE
jgi:hypothetical protein